MERPTFATLYVGVNTYDEIPAKLFISLYELKDKIDVKPGDTTRLVISNLDQLRDSLVAGYVKDGVVEPFERIISFMSELYKIDKQMPFRKLRKTSDTKYYYSGWIPRVPIIARNVKFATTELASCIGCPLTSVPPELLVLNHLVQAHKWVARYISNGDFAAFAYAYQLFDRTLRSHDCVYYSDMTKLIEAFVWFRDMEEREEIEQARKDFGILPKLNIGALLPPHLQPLDEMFRKIVSERPEVRSAVSDKKGKKVLEYSNTSVSSIWTKLEQAGVALQYDSHPFQQDHEAVVPWDSIPPELDPLAGSLTSERANRKRLQIENLVLLAKTVLRDGDTVVDFCGGGGHLSIVLAWMFPKIRVILVDRNEISLAWAKKRLAVLNLSNCEVDNCDIRSWNRVIPFQMGLAIHSCGALADIIMEKCLESQASFLVAPCCFGSLKNNNTVELPRSKVFKSSGITEGEYITLACSADKGTESWDFSGNSYVSGKRSMGFIDTDRALRAQEDGYKTFHFTMVPENCSPKNEILCGVSRVRLALGPVNPTSPEGTPHLSVCVCK